MTLLEHITTSRAQHRPLLAVLIDPEQFAAEDAVLSGIREGAPDLVLVGGSTGSRIESTVTTLKQVCRMPVVLFPGNVHQFTEKADALLMLSLISGRNPELLIGSQVSVARRVQDSGIDTLSVGYILVDGGRLSSVEKASGTLALKSEQQIVDTAIAAQLLGMQSVYLEAGSGADQPVSPALIRTVRDRLTIPLIVGGGIRTVEQMQAAYDAGADVVVIGNHFEHHPEEIKLFCNARR